MRNGKEKRLSLYLRLHCRTGVKRLHAEQLEGRPRSATSSSRTRLFLSHWRVGEELVRCRLVEFLGRLVGPTVRCPAERASSAQCNGATAATAVNNRCSQ